MKTDAQPEEVSGLLQEPEPQAEAPDPTAEPAPVVEQPEETKGVQVEEVHPELIENIDRFAEKTLKEQVKILSAISKEC